MASATTRDEEPIMSFVKTFRKLEGCNTAQLTEFMTALPRLFQQHGQLGLLLNGLKTELTRSFQSINAQLFQDMLAVLPSNEALDMNDSVTQSDDDEQPLMNLLTMPKDLKLLCCNFLVERDLYNVQKTCRCLLLAARDPNALYELIMRRRHEHRYRSKLLFSRIMSMKLNNASRLNMHQIAIACAHLRVLHLGHSNLDAAVLSALSRCVRLEKLSFLVLDVDADCVASFVAKFRSKPSPLPNLRYLTIDRNLLNFGSFLNLMLSGSAHKVTLQITGQLKLRNDISSIFSSQSQRGLSALKNVDCISLCMSNDVAAKLLMKNVAETVQRVNCKFGSEGKRFRLLEARFTQEEEQSTHFDEGLLRSILLMTSSCKQSSLSLMIDMWSTAHECLADWSSSMAGTVSTDKVLSKLCIVVSDDHGVPASYSWFPNTEEPMEFMRNNADNPAALKQKAIEIARHWLAEYRKWVAPWLHMDETAMRRVEMHSLHVSFSTYIDEELMMHDAEYDQGDVELHAWKSIVEPVVRTQLADVIDERCVREFSEGVLSAIAVSFDLDFACLQH